VTSNASNHNFEIVALFAECSYSVTDLFDSLERSTKTRKLRVPPETIVDMNGAGDAFVGGFLSQAIVLT
jgi:hypothetical protein